MGATAEGLGGGSEGSWADLVAETTHVEDKVGIKLVAP